MKKALILMLSLAICLSLVACGRIGKKKYSEEDVEYVQGLIDELIDTAAFDTAGDNTKPSESALQRELNENAWTRDWIYARQRYDSLSDEEKEDITGTWILEIDPDTYFDD